MKALKGSRTHDNLAERSHANRFQKALDVLSD